MSTHRRFLVPMIITTIVVITLTLLSFSSSNAKMNEPTTVDSRCLIYRADSCPHQKLVQMSPRTTAPTTTTTIVDLSFLNTTTTQNTTVRELPVQEPTTGASSTNGDTPTDRWDVLAQCESGGNWSTNTGNGYGGGLQFAHTSRWSTWTSFGGGEFSAHPWEATREQQIVVAERVLASSGWKAWPGCSRKHGWS